jgi:hypothetical protein
MKVSELISQLEQLQKEHGDLRVTRYDFVGISVVNYNGAKIANIRAKRPREFKTYYIDYSDRVSIEKVIHV